MPPKPSTVAAKSMTKTQIVGDIAATTGLTRSQVQEAMSAYVNLVGAELKAGRAIMLCGLVKLSVARKPASAAHPGKNPFTGEAIMVKARPARNVVKARAVKALKDMV
jgi:nucleoid DNA-binding protein